MRGYVAKRRNRFWAVIYGGIDPDHRTRAAQLASARYGPGQAEQLAARLAAAVTVAADRQGRAWAATSPGGGCQPSS